MSMHFSEWSSEVLRDPLPATFPASVHRGPDVAGVDSALASTPFYVPTAERYPS